MFNTGKATNHWPQRLEIAKLVYQKAFVMKEKEWIVCIDKYECVLGAYHCHKIKKKKRKKEKKKYCWL